jgi:hypothetical protein
MSPHTDPASLPSGVAHLVEQSASDSRLRERLLNAPQATIREEVGVEPDPPVQFVEPGHEQASNAAEGAAADDEIVRTVLLPEAESDTLSEDELESVSGGTLGDLFQEMGLDH